MATRNVNKLSPDLEAQIKSFWTDQNSKLWSFICPHCTSPRRVRYQPRPGGFHYVQIGLTAIVFTLAAWPMFNWKGLVSFLPFWLTFETIYRMKTRTALACPHCGFDPILYLTDIPKARAEIESHFRKKFAEKGIAYPGDPIQNEAENGSKMEPSRRSPEA